jgi:hypothetical protein
MNTEHMTGDLNFRQQDENLYNDIRHRRFLAVSFQKTEANKKIKEPFDWAFWLEKCDAHHIYWIGRLILQKFFLVSSTGQAKRLAIDVSKQTPFVRDFCSFSS